jgi:hypothetical protein
MLLKAMHRHREGHNVQDDNGISIKTTQHGHREGHNVQDDNDVVDNTT